MASKFGGQLENKFSKLGSLAQDINAMPEQPRVSNINASTKPMGKRSDPNYEKTSVLLDKNIRKQAARIYEDKTNSKDFSILVGELLEKYIHENSAG